MLSFKALSEKKTKITLNPKLKDVMEKKGCNHTKKGMKCPMHGMESCPDTEMSEGKKTGSCGKPAGECMCDEKTPAQKSICPTCRGTGKVDGKTCPDCGGKKTKSMEEQAYVSQEEVSEESTKEVAETETSLLTFRQFNEDRAADAKASLEKVKARQKVLDAHEKKTGKKLDITKSPEHKDHKKNFPGAKRTGKKVKGAKETPAETQDRRIRQASTRIATKGYTSKEKKEVKAMAKHASRFD